MDMRMLLIGYSKLEYDDFSKMVGLSVDKAAGGEQSFRAKVIAIRAQFPPVKVKFISTLAGDTDKLALPVPLEAFVMADKITTTEPAMPTLARLRGKRAGPHS